VLLKIQNYLHVFEISLSLYWVLFCQARFSIDYSIDSSLQVESFFLNRNVLEVLFFAFKLFVGVTIELLELLYLMNYWFEGLQWVSFRRHFWMFLWIELIMEKQENIRNVMNRVWVQKFGCHKFCLWISQSFLASDGLKLILTNSIVFFLFYVFSL
jgi:hypothetical protein